MSRTVRGSLGGPGDDEERSGRKKRNVERKPTFLSFFKVTLTINNEQLHLCCLNLTSSN